ncbi:RNA polymerase sigma-70 factor, ECF subfamily [Paenibacillus catalpae]|uniref:RNA polymerase sigma-70 factor, ECF subfamily n=1 Tax=Paenibacillus catalpae TaxID=1045775 RepID=A0A1I2BKM6_9BACL|nr:RNA polymerase sigma-70 factor [Paenibacillus catalpae]SFE56726.1 RNA polymerase sigma-70 factor, ECF subfamily [Paenibacillus catalpae]
MVELYTQYKNLLFRLAYELTGSAADAEDAVQDVFVKVQKVSAERLKEPKAYLCKMMTNHCIDLLRSARKRRELYIGPWLPEPVYESSFEDAEHHDTLSYAMLVLLERLTPAERAVFVLREALCFDYPAIAELIDKSEMNCRKLMSRAKAKMGIAEEELHNRGRIRQQWLELFVQALSHGEAEAVLSLLHEDVVLLSDGGGKVHAAIRPIVSSGRVAQFLLGIIRKAQHEEGLSVEFAALGGGTAILVRQGGHVTTAVFLSMKQDKIQEIYLVVNPEKLIRLQEHS